MPRNIDDINYSHLSPAERLVLVQDILDSVLDESQEQTLTQAQIAEIDRRCEAIDNGTMQMHAWEDVRDRILTGDDRS